MPSWKQFLQNYESGRDRKKGITLKWTETMERNRRAQFYGFVIYRILNRQTRDDCFMHLLRPKKFLCWGLNQSTIWAMIYHKISCAVESFVVEENLIIFIYSFNDEKLADFALKLADWITT